MGGSDANRLGRHRLAMVFVATERPRRAPSRVHSNRDETGTQGYLCTNATGGSVRSSRTLRRDGESWGPTMGVFDLERTTGLWRVWAGAARVFLKGHEGLLVVLAVGAFAIIERSRRGLFFGLESACAAGVD